MIFPNTKLKTCGTVKSFALIGATLLVALLGLTGCEPEPTEGTVQQTTDQTKLAKFAMESRDWKIRVAAMEKLNDQTLLTKIALEAKDFELYSNMKRDAVMKLTDQALLEKIAVESKNSPVRKAAVEKLTNQELLAKIILEAKDSHVWEEELLWSAAIKKLNDQTLLAKVAVQDKVSYVRKDAVEKLTDQAALANVAKESQDAAVRRIALRAHVAQACQTCQLVPAEHQAHLREPVFDIFDALTDPLVSTEIGDFDVQTAWQPREEVYNGGLLVKGEVFTVTVRLKKIGLDVSHCWTTDFFETIYVKSGTRTTWSYAKVDAGDVFFEICKHLSQYTLSQRACESRLPKFRLAAVKNLTDQTLLAKIAAEDKDGFVRTSAELRLSELRHQEGKSPSTLP